jgi:hypothetical protein
MKTTAATYDGFRHKLEPVDTGAIVTRPLQG